MASRAIEIMVAERDELEAAKREAQRDFDAAASLRSDARNRLASHDQEIAGLNAAINALGGEPKRRNRIRL